MFIESDKKKCDVMLTHLFEWNWMIESSFDLSIPHNLFNSHIEAIQHTHWIQFISDWN